jgi:hypothetical protein
MSGPQLHSQRCSSIAVRCLPGSALAGACRHGHTCFRCSYSTQFKCEETGEDAPGEDAPGEDSHSWCGPTCHHVWTSAVGACECLAKPYAHSTLIKGLSRHVSWEERHHMTLSCQLPCFAAGIVNFQEYQHCRPLLVRGEMHLASTSNAGDVV